MKVTKYIITNDISLNDILFLMGDFIYIQDDNASNIRSVYNDDRKHMCNIYNYQFIELKNYIEIIV